MPQSSLFKTQKIFDIKTPKDWKNSVTHAIHLLGEAFRKLWKHQCYNIRMIEFQWIIIL